MFRIPYSNAVHTDTKHVRQTLQRTVVDVISGKHGIEEKQRNQQIRGKSVCLNLDAFRSRSRVGIVRKNLEFLVDAHPIFDQVAMQREMP